MHHALFKEIKLHDLSYSCEKWHRIQYLMGNTFLVDIFGSLHYCNIYALLPQLDDLEDVACPPSITII